MIVGSMHPTILHEDSTLISADFPGLARIILQEKFLGEKCEVLYHTGPSGNLSPRHITKENTFQEAKRIGRVLAEEVIRAIPKISFEEGILLKCSQMMVDLPKKNFPDLNTAKEQLSEAKKRYNKYKKNNVPRQTLRTAEVDVFGAEETLALAEAAENGTIKRFYNECLPAEIQVLFIGNWTFIGWPGEIFVQYALEIKKRKKDAFVISLANGELQGYIATKEASDNNWYEASNALFHYRGGKVLIEKTLQLIENLEK
jgi:hypothetical protein